MRLRLGLLSCLYGLSLGCSRGSNSTNSTGGGTSDPAAGASGSAQGAAAGAATNAGAGGGSGQAGSPNTSGGSGQAGSPNTSGGSGQAGSPNMGGSSGSGQAGNGGDVSTAGQSNSPPLANDTVSGVFVHLFEWRWVDVARECENFLGPKGFTAVQVSPPSEHAVLASNGFPWWQRYQTVGYQLESRSGTRAEFIDMVSRCRAAGVGIYVDAVLNHMTAQASGTGSAGSQFTKYAYPNLYTQSDFHSPTCQIQDNDYATSAEHVQRCELLSLSDLDTGKPAVQATLARYLSDLLQLGVRGFRLDAAKHMSAPDLAAILAQVEPRADEAPYYFLEVIDYGGEAVHASDYLDVGGNAELDVTEFRYKGVGDAILGRNANIAALARMSEQAWSLLPSQRAVAFIDNHDTQRADANFYQDDPAHDLASVFMLAWPYGYPSVMSSYGFDRSISAGRDAGPPSNGDGSTLPVYQAGASQPSCVARPFGVSQGWICEHRARSVANMVAFRRATAGAPVVHAWENGRNQLAFARGDRGFVAINHDPTRLSQLLPTGLALGRYCDVLSGDFTPATGADPASCSGHVIELDASGNLALDLAPETALALHVNAKL